jgi:predicted nucleic acid-binding protein
MPTKTKKLVDSNVLVYAYDANSAFHQQAVVFLTNPNFDYYFSTKNITEYFAVLSKMGEPFAKAWQFYESASANCTLLFPTPASHAIFETLLQKYQPKGNRIYDLEIVSIAIANQIPDIGTHNVKDFDSIAEINVHPL